MPTIGISSQSALEAFIQQISNTSAPDTRLNSGTTEMRLRILAFKFLPEQTVCYTTWPHVTSGRVLGA